MTLTYQQAAEYAGKILRQMREARDELRDAHRGLADTEAAYRRGQAVAWSTVEGRSSDERRAKVDAECADLRAARDVAKGRIDVARSALSILDREAATNRMLAEWAQREGGSYQ